MIVRQVSLAGLGATQRSLPARAGASGSAGAAGADGSANRPAGSGAAIISGLLYGRHSNAPSRSALQVRLFGRVGFARAAQPGLAVEIGSRLDRLAHLVALFVDRRD